MALAFAGEVNHDGERADGHHGISGKVEHRRGRAYFRARRQGDKKVTGVGDGTVGQQSLEVILGERGEVADGHGEERGDPDERLPTGGDRLEGGQEDAEENGEGRGFWSRGEKRADRGGSALINVGSPDLEGCARNLKGKADEHERRGDTHHTEGRDV